MEANYERRYVVAVFAYCCSCCLLATNVEAVQQNQLPVAINKQLIELDWQVDNFYSTSYKQLDQQNVSYDQHLFNSIRALRYTTVNNHLDYRYSDSDRMETAVGARVNWTLCDTQLAALVNLSLARQTGSIPLSAINFLESSGRTQPGALNGNTVWFGSDASCSRASIPGESIGLSDPIKGRYCVAHMRAKSWPKQDLYFRDKISIKLALCLPDSCHSVHYFDRASMAENTEALSKSFLTAPFNSDNYEVFYLYCFPDEDSPLRRWSLSAKLFATFLCSWLALLFWCNLKYQKRAEASRRSRNTIDIKMIINQTRKDSSESSTSSKSSQSADPVICGSLQASSKPTTEQESTNDLSLDDLDETDVDLNQIKPLIESRLEESRTDESPLDLVRALSIECNLVYLFKTRRAEAKARSEVSPLPAARRSSTLQKLLHGNITSGSRRTSSSNEALIKKLTQKRDQITSSKSKVAILEANQDQPTGQKRRVDVDIFDGIKVIATGWIVYGHTLMFFFGLVTDLRFSDERMLDLTTVASINTLQVVGLFYIITGALLSYLSFSRQNKHQLMKPSTWLLVIAGRYIRLLPTYLLVFWFARDVSPYTGSGSNWLDYRTDAENLRSYCSGESWFIPLTMSAADVKIPHHCVPQAWYLSNDFRTLFILPIYIVLLSINYKAGYGAIAVTFVFSAIRMVYIMTNVELDFRVMIGWKPHVYAIMTDRLHPVYTDLSIRLSTYLLGVVVGHMLYLHETKQIHTIPDWFRKYSMRASFFSAFTFFMGAPLVSNFSFLLPSPDSLTSQQYASLIPVFKSVMELSIAMMLFLLATGDGFKWISTVLTSKPAKILSNISYGVFLVHVEVMYKIPLTRFESSYWYLHLYSVFFIIESCIVAFFLHVLFEMPVNNILRYFFKRYLSKPNS